MSQTIFLRIGERDRIPLAAFIESLRDFLGMLRDLDATISKDTKGSVIWEVVSLQQNSPPIVGVYPTPRSKKVPDVSAVVAAQVLRNTYLLTTGGQPTQFMSSSALDYLEALAGKAKRYGPSAVYVNGSCLKQESPITEKTLEHVQHLTHVTFMGYGSVVGNLESITVHKKNEFRVWDETTHKAVTCKFQPQQEDIVKALLRHRVTVSGMIYANSTGAPIKLDVEGLEATERRALPTIQEMSGLVSDFTEGKTLKEYLEAISDE
jgi:hypothetical protein